MRKFASPWQQRILLLLGLAPEVSADEDTRPASTRRRSKAWNGAALALP